MFKLPVEKIDKLRFLASQVGGGRRVRKGVSIIETVIAVLILATIGGALMAVVVQVTSATNCARLRNQAAKYAEEALEQARDFKQNSPWTVFDAKKSPPCWADGQLSTPAPGCSRGSGAAIAGATPGFTRFVELTQVSGGMRVRSVVSWTARCSSKDVEADTFLFQY